jgi:hypothetical protein
MPWAFNRDYKDLTQVADFWPDYLAVYGELACDGRYPYNDSFKGRIPGIEGPGEVTAIYLLQQTRSLRNMELKVERHRDDGWRDFDPGEIASGPVRYAGVAEYGFCMGGGGFQKWDHPRLTRFHGSVVLLKGRARVNGHLLSGKLLVKDL